MASSFLSRRVAHRHLQSKCDRTASTVHVDPLGHRWGWFAPSVQRMHLVPLDPEHRQTARVWLEDEYGNRSFQIDRTPPVGSPLDLGELRASVVESRNTVETAWLEYASLAGWLEYQPDPALIFLYRGGRYSIQRELMYCPIKPSGVQVDAHVNSVFVELPLNRVIWRGCDSGSDAIH